MRTTRPRRRRRGADRSAWDQVRPCEMCSFQFPGPVGRPGRGRSDVTDPVAFGRGLAVAGAAVRATPSNAIRATAATGPCDQRRGYLRHRRRASVARRTSRGPRRALGAGPGGASLTAMDLTLSPRQLELQARARAFVRDVLQPREAEFERANGRVARDWGDPIRRAAIEARLHGGSLPARSAARAGRSSSRSSSTSSSGRRPAACGRTCRAPTTC